MHSEQEKKVVSLGHSLSAIKIQDGNLKFNSSDRKRREKKPKKDHQQKKSKSIPPKNKQFQMSNISCTVLNIESIPSRKF